MTGKRTEKREERGGQKRRDQKEKRGAVCERKKTKTDKGEQERGEEGRGQKR